MITVQGLQQAVRSISNEIFGSRKIILPIQTVSEKLQLLEHNSLGYLDESYGVNGHLFREKYHDQMMRDNLNKLCNFSNVTIVEMPVFLYHTQEHNEIFSHPAQTDIHKVASFTGFVAGVSINKNKNYVIFQLKHNDYGFCVRYTVIE
jgi:hypothetical protein